MRVKILVVAALLLAAVGTRLAAAPAPGPRTELKRLVAELQASPDDSALRERIIKMARGLNPPPVIPEDAERYMSRGAAAMKEAQSPSGYQDAVAEFEQATLAAPWLANAYYNLGVAYDKAGDHGSAARSLKLYLLAAPNASDAKKTKSRIYELEYKQERADKEAANQRAAQEAQAQAESYLADLRGIWYISTCYIRGDSVDGCTNAEYNGTNWLLDDQVQGSEGIPREWKFIFQADGTVKFQEVPAQWTGTENAIGRGMVIGTPRGPDLSVDWRCYWKDGNTAKAWLAIDEDGDGFTVSCDRGAASFFDQSRRYNYVWFRRRPPARQRRSSKNGFLEVAQ